MSTFAFVVRRRHVASCVCVIFHRCMWLLRDRFLEIDAYVGDAYSEGSLRLKFQSCLKPVLSVGSEIAVLAAKIARSMQ